MTHTPGPWRLDEEMLLPDEWYIDCPITANGKFIAAGVNSESQLEQVRANARLMAAAPELLEALVLARSWVATRLGDTHDDLRKIDAAIAKANG